MPLLDRQAQGVVLGSIRIGTTVVGSNGKTRPTKLDTFRLTSPDRVKLDYAAEAYGGEVRPWTPQGSKLAQWELTTTVDRLPVRIPPGAPVKQDYELWTGTRQRLCDGITERLRSKGGSCLCPPDLMERKRLAADGDACKPVTRLSVVLADLPGLGVWLLSSTGDAAADELARTAELLQGAALRGVMLPAVLRLEQRESRGSGQVHHFAVPVLDVQTSLVALESGHVPQAELAAPAPRAALAAAEVPPAPPRQQEAPLPPPTGAPPTAQALADLAMQAETFDVLTEYVRITRDRGWMEAQVAGIDGAFEPLGMLLLALRSKVDPASRQQS